jgi:hypothetical protein
MKDKVVPAAQILSAKHFRREFMNFSVPRDIYVHICGTDLIRDRDGNYLVLEDNLRCPSGVSYMIENRSAMRRAFPNLFQSYGVRPVEGYSDELLKALLHIAPEPTEAERGPAHARRVQQRLLRALLPRPPDGDPDRRGPRPGRAGHARLHAHDGGPAAGRRHLPQDRRRLPRPGRVPARLDARRPRPGRRLPRGQRRPRQLDRHRRRRRQGDLRLRPEGDQVLPRPGPDPPEREHLPRLRARRPEVHPGEHGEPGREVGERGGRLRDADRARLDQGGGRGVPREGRREPAQLHRPGPDHALALAHLVRHGLEGRHIDLRPYVLCGEKTVVTPGGLTRVALRKGSLVVNSSQGGGSKDTWVLEGTSDGPRGARPCPPPPRCPAPARRPT